MQMKIGARPYSCDCKSLVDAVGNSHAPNEGRRLVQATVARLKAERFLEILWAPGHCGLIGNELADEEANYASEEHQPLVALDPATHRALIRRTCTSNCNTTPLHAATYTRSPLQQEDVLLSKSETTDLRSFYSGQHTQLRRWKNLISRSEETMCRLCDNEEDSYDHLWLRCPAFDADRQRPDLGASLDELVRLPERAQALLRIITRHLG